MTPRVTFTFAKDCLIHRRGRSSFPPHPPAEPVPLPQHASLGKAILGRFATFEVKALIACHPELVEVLPSEDEEKPRRTKSDDGICIGLDVPFVANVSCAAR